MLGLLQKGVDTESLWQKARDETKRGNQQLACAYVYLAQHRAILEIWLEALSKPSLPVVETHTIGVGKKRKGGGGGE